MNDYGGVELGGGMEIISHRGVWHHPDGRNTPEAYFRAFELGVGIELDVRDCLRSLVISHDPPNADAWLFEDFLKCYARDGKSVMLAINIKSSGISGELLRLLKAYRVNSYFVFDMATPDLLTCRTTGVVYFTRESEWEPQPTAYDAAKGVWLDQFESDWVDRAVLSRHLAAGKDVCIVSPELHKRDRATAWDVYRSAIRSGLPAGGRLMLCTDHVQQALEYFA